MLKKYVVAPMTASNMPLCKLTDAFVQTDTNATDLANVANITENMSAANTVTHVSRDGGSAEIASVDVAL